MKRILFCAACLFAAVFLCLPAGAADTVEAIAAAHAANSSLDVEVGAKGVFLYNLDTDTLIAEKNMDERMYPASLTKIMTCILALERTDNLDTEVLTYPASIQDELYRYQYVEGNGAVSLGGLIAGEQLTMRQCLYALMLPSANEVAMTIAEHLGGSQEAFAEMMNQRARELGATGTNFVNANGLFDSNHYTTPHDMAIFAAHAMELPGFMDIVTTTSYDSGPTNRHDNLNWPTTIRMQIPGNEYYYSGLSGIKTGSVPEAGACFVSTCTRDGFTYLLVVMGSPYLDDDGNALARVGSFVDTANIYDWVFKSFKRKTVVDRGEHVASITLRLSSEKDVLNLMAGERFTTLLNVATETTDVVRVTEYDFEEDHLNAPVKKGDEVGQLVLKLGGEEIGRVPLLAAETVDASPHLVLLYRVGTVLSSFWFKFFFILVILLIVLYIVLIVLRNRNRRRGGYRPRRRL